jgi:hypothetical protein
MKKVAVIVCLMMVAIFTASSAMAFDLICRSEEMIANSTCDVAGSMRLIFDQNDQTIIRNWLYGADNIKNGGLDEHSYVMVRVTMSGTDVNTNIILPKLCKDIQGAVTAADVDGVNITVPHDGTLVALTVIDTEVSDTHAHNGAGGAPDALADITAYIWGEGDPTQNQYFEIYITAFQVMTTGWEDRNNWPWVRIGQNDNADPAIRDKTTICANVNDFAGNAKLITSLNNDPRELTYTTSDNQIGHFLASPVSLVQCTKTETCAFGAETSTIELCPLVQVGQAVTCNLYVECFTAQGTFPDEDMRVTLRTNGAANGSADQRGVYFNAVTVTNRSGAVLGAGFTYFFANGTTVATPGCAFNAEQARVQINSGHGLDNDGYARFCIQYTVNPAVAVQGTNVRFWVDIATLPCGTLLNTMTTAASLVDCGRVPSCMYFPYVTVGAADADWMTGVAITNLATDVAPAAMNVTFTFTSAAGTSYTYTKSDFTNKVWSTLIDDTFMANFAGAPTSGTGWLLVQTDFTVDGYAFMLSRSLSFGAGTLPRVLNACGAYGANAFK